MRTQRLITLAIPVAIAVALMAAIYWKYNSQPPAQPPPPPAVVSSTEVIQEMREPMLLSVGSLVATHGIQVSTEVEGIVSEILFESGKPVKANEVLIKLDISVDKAALEALRAERKLSQVQFDRSKNLLKKNVTSKSEFDEVRAEFEAADARVRQQDAVIKRKIIRAPFDGLLGIRNVDLGQYINDGDAIVSLQALDPIYVDYTLPERYATQVSAGQAVKLKLDAVPGKVFSGKVTALNAGIDTGTRTLKVRAILDNKDEVLRPGMFAQVETIVGDARPVLTLPRTAVSVNTYGNFVFIINKDESGKLSIKRTAVKLGDSMDGRIIVNNLDAGTEVVRTGLVKLRDGMAVTIDNQVQLDDAALSGE